MELRGRIHLQRAEPVAHVRGFSALDVVLLVTDDDGAADTRTHTADPQALPPPAPNEPPQADFDVHCDKLTCDFEDKSKDDDGAIASWRWSLGDGATSNEQNPVHTYAERGRYDVLLAVTDDGGATDARTAGSIRRTDSTDDSGVSGRRDGMGRLRARPRDRSQSPISPS